MVNDDIGGPCFDNSFLDFKPAWKKTAGFFFVGIILFFSNATPPVHATETLGLFNLKASAVRPESSSAQVGSGSGAQSSRKSEYYSIMRSGSIEEIRAANEALLEHVVGITNSIYYDKAGSFTSRDFSDKWRALRVYAKEGETGLNRLKEEDKKRGEDRLAWLKKQQVAPMPESVFDSRESVVEGMRWIVSELNDPYSKYLAREELWGELHGTPNMGFLGLGAIVEAPQGPSVPSVKLNKRAKGNPGKSFLTVTRVDNLPIVTAIVPNSPAERAGLVVGDRVIAVGSDKFVGSREKVATKLEKRYRADNYIGYPVLTIAKPVFRFAPVQNQISGHEKEELVGYRPMKVSIPTSLVEPFRLFSRQESEPSKATTVLPEVSGGNSIVQWKLLTAETSIFSRAHGGSIRGPFDYRGVGYIRMTRFSKTATKDFTKAVSDLESAYAQSYIIDLRNCYGGVIQDAMLLASSLLRDPSSVLCYTINARGGFSPQTVEDFVTNPRYPGYFLSRESSSVVLDQVKREGLKDSSTEQKDGILWVPSTSYVSLHEQSIQKGLRKASYSVAATGGGSSSQGESIFESSTSKQFNVNGRQGGQKKIVLLVNEGTASSAEMFSAALRDNHRAVAVVGSPTFGKGLIQHTVPLPDGGGLRLTVAEYLTPKLRHVTTIGIRQLDGNFVGGIKPDIYCPRNAGISSNVGADICVGIALDALEDAKLYTQYEESSSMTLASGDGGQATKRGGE